MFRLLFHIYLLHISLYNRHYNCLFNFNLMCMYILYLLYLDCYYRLFLYCCLLLNSIRFIHLHRFRLLFHIDLLNIGLYMWLHSCLFRFSLLYMYNLYLCVWVITTC